MSKRAGKRKRGKRKPHRNRKTRPHRRCKLECATAPSSSTDPMTPRATSVVSSPGTPVADEGRPGPPRTLAEIGSWISLDLAIERLPSPNHVQGTHSDDLGDEPGATVTDEACVDADVLALDSPGQLEFCDSPKSPIVVNEDPMFGNGFRSPLPVTPGRNLDERVKNMSPLFRYRNSPECIFGVDYSPINTPPTPGCWLDVLESLGEL